jgi:hypothetical protein
MDRSNSTELAPFIEALMRVSNLNVNQAKTLVYYSVMTWSDEPKIRPIIDLHGESGTGKNSIMKQIQGWCHGAKWINASNKTPAQLRDDLEGVVTAFIEEADKTKEPKECETWYQQRFDSTGNNITYKVLEKTEKGYVVPKKVEGKFFGYTVVHTQNSFQRVELDRRIIRVTLVKDTGKRYTSTDRLDVSFLDQTANEIDWEMEIEQPASNSAWDAWIPLVRAAKYFHDDAFIKYAKEQIQSKTEEDNLTKEFEPKGLVFSEICSMFDSSEPQSIAAKDIRKALLERGYSYDERQIVKSAKELGFTIIHPHNKSTIKVESKEQLTEVARKNNISLEEDVSTIEPSAVLSAH